MKILIVSDSHGFEGNLKEVIKLESPIDMLIHLGDYQSGEARIRKMAGCRVETVPGNNDYMSRDFPDRIITIGRKNIFITHGHRYHVNYGVNNLLFAAQEKKADIVMYGHTHRPLLERYKDIIVLNPGSISEPRHAEMIPTYAIMNVDKNGEITFFLRNFAQKNTKNT